MYMWSVTLTATNTKQAVVPPSVRPDSLHPFQSIIPQNNGSNTMYLGDSNLAGNSNGLKILSGGSVGSALQPLQGFGSVLEDFYVYGTSGDNMVFMVFP